jgi:hypothetical protein
VYGHSIGKALISLAWVAPVDEINAMELSESFRSRFWMGIRRSIVDFTVDEWERRSGGNERTDPVSAKDCQVKRRYCSGSRRDR